eukprot:m.21941 g.21941  ORF g.21941 m.21941 type:complete len:65 (+) comp5401_c0_seq1:1970-2164(+)
MPSFEEMRLIKYARIVTYASSQFRYMFVNTLIATAIFIRLSLMLTVLAIAVMVVVVVVMMCSHW